MRSTFAEVVRRAGEFFMGKSPIQVASARITGALARKKIPFAVAGALAANAHGHVRTTEDVALLLTADGLARFKKEWLGRGWVEQFEGSRGLRDTTHGVRIDVRIAGEFPGDGKPKPVRFPDPASSSELDANGVPILTLSALITLKLASGLTAPHRPRDLDDVIQLIRVNGLPLGYGDQLDPYVRGKFREMWHAAQIRDES
ncbi:MAG: hypothetical protein HY812_04115 [Planctomycetes bacterium]|nr:hypothetical protein [Planctomycetota bacterium]